MGQFTVDDTDTVQLDYNTVNKFQWFHGNWTDYSTTPPSNQSLLSSNDLTAQLVLRFPSPGTGFAYYGMQRAGGGIFKICIDCDPNQPAGPFETIDALNRTGTGNGRDPPVLLYSNQNLSNDMHTVVLMNTNDTRVHPGGTSQITLDRFVITTQDPAVVTVTSSDVSNGPTGSPISGTSTSSVNPGLIAGVVIGALALLALLVGLGLCFRRKRRSNWVESVEEEGRVTVQRPRLPHSPNPLIVRPSQRGHRPNPSASSFSSSTSVAALPAKGAVPVFALREHIPSKPSSPPPAASSTSENTSSTAFPPLPRPRTEMDAGPVPEDEDTLPPDYAQVFNSQPQPGPSVREVEQVVQRDSSK